MTQVAYRTFDAPHVVGLVPRSRDIATSICLDEVKAFATSVGARFPVIGVQNNAMRHGLNSEQARIALEGMLDEGMFVDLGNFIWGLTAAGKRAMEAARPASMRSNAIEFCYTSY